MVVGNAGRLLHHPWGCTGVGFLDDQADLGVRLVAAGDGEGNGCARLVALYHHEEVILSTSGIAVFGRHAEGGSLRTDGRQSLAVTIVSSEFL